MDMYDGNNPRKFNAEIMIRANSEAETRQLEELERQTRENDALIQEMRSLNARNIEVMNRVESLLANASMPAPGEDEERALILSRLAQVMHMIREKPDGGNEAVMARLEELTGMVEEGTKASNDYVHSENVKVYRNVQAALKDELTKNNQVITDAQNAGLKETLDSLEIDTSSGVQTATLVIAILALICALGGFLFQVLTFFQIIV